MNFDFLFIICPPVWEKLPPLGVAYLCEYLKLYGYSPAIYDINISAYNKIDNAQKKDWTINTEYTKVNFFDYCFNNHHYVFDNLIKQIKTISPEHIGFSVLKNNRIFSIKTSAFIKSCFPDIKIIFGGPETLTMHLEGNYPDSIDYFVLGEGEKALLSILSGKTKDKTITFDQLDDINFFPKFQEFNLDNYTRNNSLPILFSRGCTKKCSFCSEKLLFKGYRTKDPQIIVEEIKHHRKNNNIQWFTFYDSMINGNLNQLEQLMDLMICSNLNISWDAQLSIISDMDTALMEKMKQAGCVNLFIGLESASDRILSSMKKNYTSQNAAEFLNKLKQAGLQYEISLILDYPGETDEDFRKTASFIEQNRNIIKKIAQINTYKYYPGTEILHTASNSGKGQEKTKKILNLLEKNNIHYTKQFINNLI